MGTKLIRQFAVATLGLTSCAIGLVLFVVLSDVVSIRFIRAGMLEGPGRSQAFRSLLGGPLLILLAMAWLALVIFCFDYYGKGVHRGELVSRFARVTAVQMFCFPLVVLSYQIAYPISMMFTDWVLASGGLFLGTISLWLVSVEKGRCSDV